MCMDEVEVGRDRYIGVRGPWVILSLVEKFFSLFLSLTLSVVMCVCLASKNEGRKEDRRMIKG